MDKYLGVYESDAAISAAVTNNTLKSPYVAIETSGNTLSYNGSKVDMVVMTPQVDDWNPGPGFDDEEIVF